MGHSRTLTEVLELRPKAPCGHPAPCGCRHAACCFECPLAECQFDKKNGNQSRKFKARELVQARREAARNLKDNGVAPGIIAKVLHVSRRTIWTYTHDNHNHEEA